MSNIERVESAPENELNSHGDLVVVGSSAGGIEALSILVSSLPTDFPAPIVLAQHLDPKRNSNLDVILRHHATLPVELVETRCLMERGHVYVVPANRHVVIEDGHVEVQSDHHLRHHPSVDLLLSTAADVYGDRLIAVILTGTGSDGAVGAVHVKNAGGTVIVQDPLTARHPAMPLALPPAVVDFEADIERIGQLLYDLLTNTERLQPLEEKSEDTLQRILEVVSQHVSVNFRLYKSSTILRRLARRMTVTHQKTMRDYLDYLESHPEEIDELVKAFLINVTQFFRDSEAFHYLKTEILPRLIAQAREHDRVLRFWAAGCASGEEAYSLAMIVTDLLSTELAAWSVKIFATDLDETTIAFARRGLYSESLLKDVPMEYRNRFFEWVDHGYRISKTLRQMVIFGQHDLARSAPFPRINLVLCRNVLIYFTPELQDYVLNQFAFSLAPNGYLFLGKAETIRPSQSYFELINKQWKMYRCNGKNLPLAVRYSSDRLDSVHSHPLNRPGTSNTTPMVVNEQSASSLELGQLRRLNELLLRFLPIGVVVIDRSYHIVTANGTARRLLGLRELSNEQDFLHAVRGIPYTMVRNAIDAVFRERSSLNLPEIELDMSSGGSGRFVSLSIALMQIEAGIPDLIVMSASDVTEQIQIRHQLESAQIDQAQLMEELSSANKRLNNVNKELLDANEELQVANEELMITHEELQATLEEFETTNEELQATNEELETNNEELQATNEELETTNDELRARSGELQELMTLLEGERVRVAEMVELAPFSILVLRGPHLLVEAYNPRYTPAIEGRNVLDQPLIEVYELFWEAGIEGVHLAREVFQHGNTRTTPRIRTSLLDAEGNIVERYFVYTMVPSHDADGNVSGVIVYAIDETVQQAQEAQMERERLQLMFEHSTALFLGLFDAASKKLLLASPPYLDMLARNQQSDATNLIGKPWSELASVFPEEQREDIWRKTLERRTPYSLPEVHYRFQPEDSEIILILNLIPIVDTENRDKVLYMLLSMMDITDQVQARQEMEQLNRLKDDFLSLAGHELRTPLTAIMGYTELLNRTLKKVPDLNGNEAGSNATRVRNNTQEQQSLEQIIHQVRRMARLIDELVDLTHMRNELFRLNLQENVNLVSIVRQVIDQNAAYSNRKITLKTAQEPILITTDEARLEQVLNNLVSNAIKYSPADKPITVTIEQNKQQVVVGVQDQGEGLNEEEQVHIFERFYRANAFATEKIDGLGLGLYIASEIMSRLGGRLWVESQKGHGSTFFVSLPLTRRTTNDC